MFVLFALLEFVSFIFTSGLLSIVAMPTFIGVVFLIFANLRWCEPCGRSYRSADPVGQDRLGKRGRSARFGCRTTCKLPGRG